MLIVTRVAADSAVILLVCTVLFTELSAETGLLLDLRSPHLQWTSESVPVKQSVTMLLCLFGGWLVAAAIGLGGFLLCELVAPSSYLIGCLVVLALAVRLLSRRIASKGAERWDTLV